MTTSRVRRDAGWIGVAPKGQDGRPVCRYCGGSCPKPRRTFCSDACVHEWRIRTDPGYVRKQVLQRDKGLCALCGVNAEELRAKATRDRPRSNYGESYGNYQGRLARYFSDHYPGFPSDICRSWWEADHIVPVVEGGGECGLDGYRTLCRPCHVKVTRELAARRAAARRAVRTPNRADPDSQTAAHPQIPGLV